MIPPPYTVGEFQLKVLTVNRVNSTMVLVNIIKNVINIRLLIQVDDIFVIYSVKAILGNLVIKCAY